VTTLSADAAGSPPTLERLFQMRVPFNAPGRQVARLRTEIDAAIADVLSAGRYVMGDHHAAFENAFAAYCGAGACLGVGNGTDALEIALRSVGCKAGDRVACVANAGGYTTTACLALGAVPVYVDVDGATLLMSPDALRAALTSDFAAVVVTHLFGALADMEAIVRISSTCGVPVIEDCAQAHGAWRDGRHAGTLGDVGTFSFYPTKNLGALGDGGALITGSESLADRIRLRRQYGWESRYRAVIAGGRNSRLDEIQAAILSVKLPHLNRWNERRRWIVSAYRDAGAGVGISLVEGSGEGSAAHLAVARVPDRDVLAGRMAERGVETSVHFPVPDHWQPSMEAVRWDAGDLSVTERACREVLSLPCYPELTDAEVDYVCEVLASP
jgi:aminotransferase EvaB